MAKYRVDLQDLQRRGLTMGETRDLSRIGGMTVGELQMIDSGDYSNLPLSAMIAIVYIIIRRSDPRITEADINGMSWEDFEFVQPTMTGDDGTADPPAPLPPLKATGRKSSARSVATTA